MVGFWLIVMENSGFSLVLEIWDWTCYWWQPGWSSPFFISSGILITLMTANLSSSQWSASKTRFVKPFFGQCSNKATFLHGKVLSCLSECTSILQHLTRISQKNLSPLQLHQHLKIGSWCSDIMGAHLRGTSFSLLHPEILSDFFSHLIILCTEENRIEK